MRWVTDERGAAAVTMAVVSVVLISMAAFAIDVGAMYQERRELQNGADAAALAIAEDCALDAAPCTAPYAAATADGYADQNASDKAARVPLVDLDPIARRVTIAAATEELDGATALAPFFAQVMGFSGSTVQAEATAEWGYPRKVGLTLPLIISDCEWEATDPEDPNYPRDARTLYLNEAEGPPPDTGPKGPATFLFHDGNSPRLCEHHTSGFELPSGFGWLVADSGPCKINPGLGDILEADPGSSPSNSCTPELVYEELFPSPDVYPNNVVHLPYFDEFQGTGSEGRYQVLTLGAFYVTGYNFGGPYKASRPGYPIPCGGDERCFSAYFLDGAITYDGDLGGPDRGTILIKLTN